MSTCDWCIPPAVGLHCTLPMSSKVHPDPPQLARTPPAWEDPLLHQLIPWLSPSKRSESTAESLPVRFPSAGHLAVPVLASLFPMGVRPNRHWNRKKLHHMMGAIETQDEQVQSHVPARQCQYRGYPWEPLRSRLLVGDMTRMSAPLMPSPHVEVQLVRGPPPSPLFLYTSPSPSEALSSHQARET